MRRSSSSDARAQGDEVLREFGKSGLKPFEMVAAFGQYDR
jgi:uncharacterized protein with GYD domain